MKQKFGCAGRRRRQMTHYLNLVPISAEIYRKLCRMTRICITLAVLLVAVMFGLADMYLQGITRKEMQSTGNWHYQFTGLDAQTAAFISSRPETAVSGWHSTVPGNAGYSVAGMGIAVSAQEKDVFQKIFLNGMAEGKYPATEDEIAVSASLKDSASFSLNDVIGLARPDGSKVSYTIVGFLSDAETPRLVPGAEPVAALTPEGFAALTASMDTSVTNTYLVQFSRFYSIPDTMADIKTQYHISDIQITGNLSFLTIQGQTEGKTGVNQIYQVAAILSIIVMLTCILMISSSLNSNVAQRTKFFGMLRCLGATKKQIMRFVCYEGLYWCKTAIPAGIVFSVLIVWILSSAMRTISPQWFSCMPRFGISWIGMSAGTVLGLLTVLIAGRSPAGRAAKVSPLTAITGNTEKTASFRRVADTRFFKLETALGIYQAKAEKGNYLLMTGAFAICITLFLTFNTLVDFMGNAFQPPEWTPELSIVSETNACSIDSGLLEKVNQTKAVKRAYGRMFAYGVPAETGGADFHTNVISYETNQFRWAEGSLLSGSIDAVMRQENQVLFVKTENVDVQVGDTITLSINNGKHTVTVAGILSGSPLARAKGMETVFCSEKTFAGLTGETGYTIIDVQFQNSASAENVREVERIFSEGSVVFTDKLSKIQQQRNLYYAFSVLVYGFLSIIVVITVFQIMNTINRSAAAKMKKYGFMRAIGMSSRQLERMLIAESGTYAVSGVIAGCIIGLPMHWVIFVSLITNLWGTAWSIPFLPLGFILAIVLFTSLLAAQGPARRLRQMSIIENISTQ